MHLREFDFGDPGLPLWVIDQPLSEAPFHLDAEAFDREMLALLRNGWIRWKKPKGKKDSDPAETDEEVGGTSEPQARQKGTASPSKSVHIDEEILVTKSALTLADELRREIQKREPDVPDDLASLVLLSDLVRSPDGLELDDVQRALEDPPSSLTDKEAPKTYWRLMKSHWIFLTERKGSEDLWFPSPRAWAHAQRIDEALAARESELRERLAVGNADALKLPRSSPLRKALHEIDRSQFVPADYRRLAYRNRPCPIAFDENGDSATTTSSPNVCAMVAHTLEVAPADRVLICGVKGGFTAALCAHVAGPKGRVVCLETNPRIAEYARASIERAGFSRRVEVRLVKDVTVGLEDQEPWDAVVVNGKIPKVPRPIIRQMIDGGRMLIFLQDGESTAQTAYLIRKNGKAVDNQELSSFSFTPIFGEFGYDPPNWTEDLHLVGQQAHDVFVSYSTKDQEDCDRIVKAFEAVGLRCWMSARNHPVGKDGYEQAIMEALKGARLFLIVLSHQSVASDHVKNELTNATSLRKTILPLRLSECPNRLPANFQYHLERHQQFDCDKHPMQQVLAAALQLLGSSAPDGQRPMPAAQPIVAPASESRRAAFDALLEEALADGRLTQAELRLLCRQAVTSGVAADTATAQKEIERLVRQRNTRAKMPK